MCGGVQLVCAAGLIGRFPPLSVERVVGGTDRRTDGQTNNHAIYQHFAIYSFGETDIRGFITFLPTNLLENPEKRHFRTYALYTRFPFPSDDTCIQ